MKTKAEKLTYEYYYKILEHCISNVQSSKTDIAEALNISEDNSCFKQLLNALLIRGYNGNNNIFEITAEGLATYLSLQAQKRADKQARTATYIAVASLVVATIAIGINIWELSK